MEIALCLCSDRERRQSPFYPEAVSVSCWDDAGARRSPFAAALPGLGAEAAVESLAPLASGSSSPPAPHGAVAARSAGSCDLAASHTRTCSSAAPGQSCLFSFQLLRCMSGARKGQGKKRGNPGSPPGFPPQTLSLVLSHRCFGERSATSLPLGCPGANQGVLLPSRSCK